MSTSVAIDVAVASCKLVLPRAHLRAVPTARGAPVSAARPAAIRPNSASVKVERPRGPDRRPAEQRARAAGAVRHRLEADGALGAAGNAAFETGKMLGRLGHLSAASTTYAHGILQL